MRTHELNLLLVVALAPCVLASPAVAATPPSSLSSTALTLQFSTNPFSFSVTENATGLVLLSQAASEFTFDGTAYMVSSAGNVVAGTNTLDADLFFGGFLAPGHIRFAFTQPEILQVTLTSGNSATRLRQQFADQGENYYGVWEYPDNGDLNLRGIARPFLGVLERPGVNACSAHAPFYMTSRHYAIYAQSEAQGDFSMAVDNLTSFGFDAPELVFHVIYGPDYAAMLSRYNTLAGGACMPPTWAFDSIWWMDDFHDDFHGAVANAQENVMDLAAQLSNNRIPASGLWIDRPYTSGYTGWGNLDFDSSFPNPGQMINDLGTQGYNLMIWIANRCWGESYLWNQGSPAGYLFPGYDSDAGPAVDLRNPDAYDWLKTSLDFFVDLGIKGYKIDRGEEGEHPDSLQNLNVTLFHKLAAEGQRAVHPNDNFIFARNVCDTGRRYAAVWGGDPYGTFSSMQYVIASGLRAGMMNFPMWGGDVGGYVSAPLEEVFARWFEFGAYSPMMETLVGGGHTPWYDYSPQLVAIARAQAAAHHDLIPYSRSCLYQATQTGMPVMRSLLLEFPNDAAVANMADEYLYGPHLLVAPVCTSGATNRSVYLPAGTWLDYSSQAAVYAGPATPTLSAPLDTIPLLVREGAIIPRGDIWKGNNNWTPNWTPKLRIEFFPSDQGGSSFAYYTGSSVQMLTCTNQSHLLTIQFGDLGFNGSLEVHLQAPGGVTSNGVTLVAGRDYSYNPAARLLRVPFNGATSLVVSNAYGLFSPFEVWQTSRFGNTTNSACAPSANPAGDGIPNFLKYALGLDPFTAYSRTLLNPTLTSSSGTNFLTVSFQRATNATDCTFTVTTSTNLVQWQTGSTYSGTSVIPNTAFTTELSRVTSNGVERITVRDNVPLQSAPRRFMGLRVSQ